MPKKRKTKKEELDPAVTFFDAIDDDFLIALAALKQLDSLCIMATLDAQIIKEEK